MTDDILLKVEGHAGFISLNRPSALHALTLPMVHAMTAALLKWRDDPAVKCVVIDHADGRGFCAGGDIAFLRNSAMNDGGESGRQFFHDEYQLNHLLVTYPKPVVAFMDGITMGGGVGISQPARPRTQNLPCLKPALACFPMLAVDGIFRGLRDALASFWRLPARVSQAQAVCRLGWPHII
jgi:enoyl-CoA hydratase/carnithine racemase